MRLELPEEEKEVLVPVPDNEGEILAVCKVEEKEDSICEATAKDACTQTPRKRRRGGRVLKLDEETSGLP